jgi:FkbM family methyltransferase
VTGPVRREMRWLRYWWRGRRFAHGDDRRLLYRLLRATGTAPTGEVERVRFLPLDGNALELRPGTTDALVAVETFAGGYHLPVYATPRRVWDLGANIGATVASLAATFSEAEITGVELLDENAALAERNVRPWQERCSIVTAAAWTTSGTVQIRVPPANQVGAKVSDQGELSVLAISLNDLLCKTGPPDYVKMDVEGAEKALLVEHTAWAAEVGEIRVECHGSYGIADCERDLQRLGFRTEPHPERLSRPSVIGIRTPSTK